ncbi:MAG: NAD(P)/FAD-dependent oxidoreductase [Nitrospira sp.]
MSIVAAHPNRANVVIIGAGAAGLTAAIACADGLGGESASGRVILLDGTKRIGAKILVSGGGRCNVTHDVVTPKDFFGNRNIIRNVLAARSVHQTIAWFASLGVDLKREPTGKLFPVTDRARTVLDALLNRADSAEVTICPDYRVNEILWVGSEFRIVHRHGTMHAARLILATGGRSLPRTGSDGFGYQLVRSLGHRVAPTVPALVPLVLEPSMFHATLSGLSHEIELTTVVEGREVDRRTGSLLWTHFGISGPVVLDVSRFWTLATHEGTRVDLYANFASGRTRDEAKVWLTTQATEHPKRSLAKTLTLLVPERLAHLLCRYCSCDPQTVAAQVPRMDRNRLLDALTRFRFPVERDRGWGVAEVTAGGVPLEEINYRTMESKLTSGLYLAGEILDCDGRIGGFNFQWAWSTGWLAGRSAAESLMCQSKTSPNS